MMRRLLGGQSGATSVLIIFMMLVLVILGAYSISSAHVNYTFSSRALEWKRAYYECDSKAAEFLMDTDSALARAESGTAEAVIRHDPGIPQANAAQWINALYVKNVLKEFALLSDKYDIEIHEDGPDVSTVVSSGGNSRISVRIAAAPFRYSVTQDGGTIKCALKGNGKRYAVLEWREAQKINGDNATQEPLWNGAVR